MSNSKSEVVLSPPYKFFVYRIVPTAVWFGCWILLGNIYTIVRGFDFNFFFLLLFWLLPLFGLVFNIRKSIYYLESIKFIDSKFILTIYRYDSLFKKYEIGIKDIEFKIQSKFLLNREPTALFEIRIKNNNLNSNWEVIFSQDVIGGWNKKEFERVLIEISKLKGGMGNIE